jgi:hypothetical protein
MDFAPRLTPWYVNKDRPKLIKDGKTLVWRNIDKVDKEPVVVMTLEDDDGNCFAVVDMYCYILAYTDHRSFIIWSRSLGQDFNPLPIFMHYYDTDNLKPFAHRDTAILKLKEQRQPFAFSVNPTSKIEVQFNPKEGAMKFDFPAEFKKFKEFIFVTEMPNLYFNPNPANYWHNTTMLDFKADKGWIFNYPQDWFNKSNSDFGYQWITRAIRNPVTNLIYGQGIRIDDFILDDTNRQHLNQNDKRDSTGS